MVSWRVIWYLKVNLKNEFNKSDHDDYSYDIMTSVFYLGICDKTYGSWAVITAKLNRDVRSEKWHVNFYYVPHDKSYPCVLVLPDSR